MTVVTNFTQQKVDNTTIIDTNYYEQLLNYNEQLFTSYSAVSGYNEALNTNGNCNGDMLRMIYPGVLLIELSKLPGNPIGPYADKNSFTEELLMNINALNNVIGNINDLINQNNTLSLKPNKKFS